MESRTKGRQIFVHLMKLPVRMMEVPVSLMKLPVNLAVSSMTTISDSIHEIQRKSEESGESDDPGEGGAGNNSAFHRISRSVLSPYLAMFSLPRNVFASGVKTFGDTMQELRDRSGARGGHGSDKSAKQRALEPVLLTAEEAALESEALLTEEAERLPRTILWQIGRSGRRDYEAKWTDEFDYWIGRDLDPIHSPAIPHLLMAKGGPKAGGATEQLNIHFTLTREYPERGLVLIFDRWGAEKDEVRVDEELLAPVGGAGEGKFRHVALSLRGLSSGDHVITITTTGATGSEGHRIDSIMLAALDEPAKR